jgi:hypothetical protein
MSIHPAMPVTQLRDYSVRLAAARDRSYSLARQVEHALGTLNTLEEDPASDPTVCDYARQSLESLCETLVRLCSLTDQASDNAGALASLPTDSFGDDRAAASELDTAVSSVIDATVAAEVELSRLTQIVADVCEAVDEMAQGRGEIH